MTLVPSVMAVVGDTLTDSAGGGSSSVISSATLPLPAAPPVRLVPEFAFKVGRLIVNDSESPSSRLSEVAVKISVASEAVGVAAPVKVTVGALPRVV